MVFSFEIFNSFPKLFGFAVRQCSDCLLDFLNRAFIGSSIAVYEARFNDWIACAASRPAAL